MLPLRSAVNAPHRSLGMRTQAHLDALLASRHPASVSKTPAPGFFCWFVLLQLQTVLSQQMRHQLTCRCTAPLCRRPLQAIAVLNGLALCTEAVLACADIVVAGGGLPVLLGIAQASGRGKEAAEALQAALHCLTNICRSRWAAGLPGGAGQPVTVCAAAAGGILCGGFVLWGV